jgi:hypothetical protein
MQSVSYVFYRYSIHYNDSPVSPAEQWDLFKRILALEVAHRKTDESEAEKDTSLVELDQIPVEINGEEVVAFFFKIAKHITARDSFSYDKDADRMLPKSQSTDEYCCGQIVVVPSVRVLAAADRSGTEYLSAISTVSRLRSIIHFDKRLRLLYEPTGSKSDIMKALKGWRIEEISFAAKPYNPSIHTPGDRLHSLLAPDNARISGRARPVGGEFLTPSEDGFIEEIVGLREKGYADLGARGKTQQGYEARIQRGDAEKQGKPRIIKVTIPIEPNEPFENQMREVARAILEIYG